MSMSLRSYTTKLQVCRPPTKETRNHKNNWSFLNRYNIPISIWLILNIHKNPRHFYILHALGGFSGQNHFCLFLIFSQKFIKIFLNHTLIDFWLNLLRILRLDIIKYILLQLNQLHSCSEILQSLTENAGFPKDISKILVAWH